MSEEHQAFKTARCLLTTIIYHTFSEVFSCHFIVGGDLPEEQLVISRAPECLLTNLNMSVHQNGVNCFCAHSAIIC